MIDQARLAIWLELDQGGEPAAVAPFIDAIVSTEPGPRWRGAGGPVISTILDLGAELDRPRLEQRMAFTRTVDGVVLPSAEWIGSAIDAARRRRWLVAMDVYSPEDFLQSVLLRADVAIANSVEIGEQVAPMAGDRPPRLVVRVFDPSGMAAALRLAPWGVSTSASVLAEVRDRSSHALGRTVDTETYEVGRPHPSRSKGGRDPSNRPIPLMAAPDIRRLEERHGDV